MPHIKLEFHHSQVRVYSQEWVNVIFLHLWPQKLYRAFRFGTLWPISCSYPRHSQLTRHSLMLANGRIRQSLTALVNIFIEENTSENVVCEKSAILSQPRCVKSVVCVAWSLISLTYAPQPLAEAALIGSKNHELGDKTFCFSSAWFQIYLPL